MVTYELGDLANWLSAFGTISAVITALYLSKKETKPKARVTSKYAIPVGVGHSEINREPIYVCAEIVNQGLVPIYLSECTFKVTKKDRMVFLDGSHNVKKLLNPGEYYEHKLNFHDIKAYFISKNIRKFKTHIFFSDASGKEYKAKIIFRF